MYLALLLMLLSTHLFAYDGSTISEAWGEVMRDQYLELPQTEVNMERMTKWGKDKLAQAANRTLERHDDLLPYFEKLVHANGICLIGQWKIDAPSSYSGHFKKGSEGLIISRASVALSNTQRGERRSVGLTGKIYPTTNFNNRHKLRPANFFTLDDLAGTKLPSFFDTTLTNQPEFTFNFGVLWIARLGYYVSNTFSKADINPGLRQLWQISSLGETDPSKIKTPMWMRLRANKPHDVSSESDFRAEIADAIRVGGELVYTIEVAGEMKKGAAQTAEYQKIGTIRYTQAIASSGCDHRLHFNHPKDRTDIE